MAARFLKGAGPAYLPLVALALGALCEAVFVIERWDEWQDSQLAAALLQGGVVVFVAPLAAAAAAADFNAVRRSALGVTAQVQRRDRAGAAASAGRVGGLLLAVHLIVFAVMIAVLRHDGLGGALPLAAALPGALMIVAFALVGAAVGWRVRSLAAAPLATALSFAVLLPVAYGAPSAVLQVGAGYNPLAQLRVGWVALSTLSAVLIGVAALAAVRRRRGSAAVAGLACAAVAGLLFVGPAEAVHDARGPVACAGRAPQVCAYPERRGRLPALRTQIVRLTAALQRLASGAPLPARWTEGDERASRAVALLELADPADQASIVDDVAASLVRCSPDAAVEPVVSVWLDRAVYGARAVAPAAFGDNGPPSHFAPARLERGARRAVAATRRDWCR